MADIATRQFFGIAQTVINSATDIAAGNFSGAPAASFDNTSDTAVPFATHAQAMIEMPDWGAAPAAGTLVELWGVLQNTNSTSDDTDAPSGTSSGGARFFGAWWVSAVDALQRRTITISLEGVNSHIDFYIKNGTAQNMNNDGGTNCIVKITPFCYGVTTA
jgi:hypothetical protein